jgi:uncharacterized membrane protein YkvA (DUF1232 family)
VDPTPGKGFLQSVQSAEAQSRANDPETRNRVREGFHEAASRLKGALAHLWDDLHDAYRMLFDGEFEVKTPQRVALFAALAYVVSPLDVLPDWLPFLGQADDVAVVTAALAFARPEIDRYRAFREGRPGEG